MLLSKGLWAGKGSLLAEGVSLGVEMTADLEVVEAPDGITITGSMSGGANGQVSVRIAANEVGTYVIDARMLGAGLDGIAKLESQPNHSLLWNEAQTQLASVALFPVDRGLGCRGFYREGGKTVTWEMLIQPKQQVVSGDNVVSLMRRR